MAVLGLIALIIGLFVPFLVIGLGAWMGRRAEPSPACGRCGYSVRGLPTFTCPECGGDLREVGIVAPGMRPQMGPLEGRFTQPLPRWMGWVTSAMLSAILLVLAYMLHVG